MGYTFSKIGQQVLYEMFSKLENFVFISSYIGCCMVKTKPTSILQDYLLLWPDNNIWSRVSGTSKTQLGYSDSPPQHGSPKITQLANSWHPFPLFSLPHELIDLIFVSHGSSFDACSFSFYVIALILVDETFWLSRSLHLEPFSVVSFVFVFLFIFILLFVSLHMIVWLKILRLEAWFLEISDVLSPCDLAPNLSSLIFLLYCEYLHRLTTPLKWGLNITS